MIKCAIQRLIRSGDAEILIRYLREVDVELILIQQCHQQRLLLCYVADSDEILHRVCGNFGIDIPIEERLSCHVAPDCHEFIAGVRRFDACDEDSVIGHQLAGEKVRADKSLLCENLFKPLYADCDMLLQLLDEDKLPFAPPPSRLLSSITAWPVVPEPAKKSTMMSPASVVSFKISNTVYRDFG